MSDDEYMDSFHDGYVAAINHILASEDLLIKQKLVNPDSHRGRWATILKTEEILEKLRCDG